MPSDSLQLARLDEGPEIFHSLQGEGVSLGLPSIFIRASLCNLHCRWCDTDYTWNWQGTPWPHERDHEPGYQKFDRQACILTLPVSEVAEQVSRIPCHNVILTGGEPLLQDQAWCALMTELRHNDPRYRFEVESNGTLQPSEAFEQLVSQYNISPKLANSGNPESLRIRAKALEGFARNPKAWFKFVVTEEQDLDEIKELIQHHRIARERVLLMPEGRDDATLQKRRLWLAEICCQNGFRYSDRLHIQLWGSKRGV